MIVKAICDENFVERPVLFRLNKETFVELPEDGHPWFTTKDEFRRFLRGQQNIRYMAANTKRITSGELKSLARREPDCEVQFYSEGAFKIGCMYFDRDEAKKIRKWVRGGKKNV